MNVNMHLKCQGLDFKVDTDMQILLLLLLVAVFYFSFKKANLSVVTTG